MHTSELEYLSVKYRGYRGPHKGVSWLWEQTCLCIKGRNRSSGKAHRSNKSISDVITLKKPRGWWRRTRSAASLCFKAPTLFKAPDNLCLPWQTLWRQLTSPTFTVNTFINKILGDSVFMLTSDYSQESLTDLSCLSALTQNEALKLQEEINEWTELQCLSVILSGGHLRVSERKGNGRV